MKRRWAELWIMVTADRRRATILGILLILLVGVGVKTMWLQGPKRARAGVDAASGSESVGDATTEKGKKSSRKDSGSRTRSSSAASASEPAALVSVVRAPRVTRDIFKLDDEIYPPPQTDPPDESARLAEKSPPRTDEKPIVDPTPSEDDVRRRVTQEASRLRLRSILLGARPAAVIEAPGDGRKERSLVLAVGQTVEGFTVVAVAQDGVTVEKEGVQIALKRPLPEQPH